MILRLVRFARILARIQRIEVNPGTVGSLVFVPITAKVRALLSHAAVLADWIGFIVIAPPGVGPDAQVFTVGKLTVVWIDPSRCNSEQALTRVLQTLALKAVARDKEAAP